jgi:hypothetical protein
VAGSGLGIGLEAKIDAFIENASLEKEESLYSSEAAGRERKLSFAC